LNSTRSDSSESFSSNQRTVLWVLWLTYGSLYFCRNNLGVALPGIEKDLGYTKAQLGTVLACLKLAYAVGQFINGQMAEHVRPRTMLAVGMLASAALNVVFGWSTSLYFLTFIWACNGYVQALGWAPTVRTAANWFSSAQRGRALGIIATGYQLCGALTFFLAGWAAEKFGWRGALYVPAVLLTVSSVHMLFFLKDSPRQEATAGIAAQLPPIHSRTLRENLGLTLTNPSLWLVAICLGLLDACRYGFTDWGVTHLKEVQNASISTAAFKYAILPLGGICGALVSGWATDRFFGGRRAPVICILLLTLGLAALAYDYIIHWGFAASLAILFVVGFCIFGPQILLVGTLPADLARKGTAAAAAGFVNFMGYIGAAAGDKVTGHLADGYGWGRAVLFWALCAFAGAAVIAFLWNTGTRSHGSKAVSQDSTPTPATKAE
jgi:sugar phosphate permease